MNIDYGIQPNCSELVIYLSGWGIDEIREKLAINGIEEIIAKNYYVYDEDNEPGEWDDEKKIPERKTLLYSENPEIAKLLKQYDYGTDEEQENAKKELEKLGFSPFKTQIMLTEKDKTFNWDDYGTVRLSEQFEDNEPAIVGHQHCQKQIYPLLKKISDIFGISVSGYDGGSEEEYNSWLNSGCPDIDTWEYN